MVKSGGCRVFAVALVLLAIPVLWAAAEWRMALLLCLVTAILQDPLRKLTPDQPFYFVVFVGAVFAAGCLGALARGIRLNPSHMFNANRRLATLFFLLTLLFILQAAHSFLRFENVILPLGGLMAYAMPFWSVVFAYQLVSRRGDLPIRQFIKWYLILTSFVLITVCLEFYGYEWPVFGQVVGATKFIIFDQTTGAILQPAAG